MNPSQTAVPLFSWVRPGQWLLLDELAGVAYGMLAFVVLGNGASSASEWLAALVGAACLAVPVATRRRAPVRSLAVLLVTLAVMAVSAPSTTVMALPPVVLVLYTVSVRTRSTTGAAAMAVACACVVATHPSDPLHPGGIVIALPVFVAAWALGATFRLHRRHLQVQLELQERLRHAQERQAELELVDQRVRIARDLHDVVAHGMSVITVQAGFAGLVADDVSEVRSALGSIETTGRQTLREMRTLLEFLRDGTEPDEPALSPAPGLADLDPMIELVREAGVDVVLTRRGRDTPLPAMVELNAYRIVQEALTNVIKHSGHVSATVVLEREDDALAIRICDDGQPGPERSVEPGHGINGMRERARILGGTLRAGALPGGGYEVTCRLPIPNRAADSAMLTPDST